MGARRWVSVSSVAVISLGCHGADGSSASGLDDLVAGVQRMTCLAEVCTYAADPSVCGFVPQFEAEVAAALRIPGPRRAEDLQRAMERGTTVFDSARAAACVAEIERVLAMCWGPTADERDVQNLYVDVRRWAGRCAGVFTGTVPAGGSCVTDEECATGLCNATAARCPGTCVTAPSAGFPCVTLGPSPSDGPAEQRCAGDLECVFNPEGPQLYLCVARGSQGTRCRADADCAAGLSCDLDGVCTTCPDPQRPSRCARTYDGTCRRGDVAIGADEECEGRQVCAGSGETGTCQVPLAGGAACGTAGATACLAPFRCDGRVCAPPPAIGEPCTSICATGAVCRVTLDGPSRCVALKANGEPCDQDIECLGGDCNAEHRCQRMPEAPGCHYPSSM